MTERKNIIILTGFALAVSLVAASLTAGLLSKHHNQIYNQVLGQICQGIADNLNNTPQAEAAILTALKEYSDRPSDAADADLFLSYGYQQTDFLKAAMPYDRFFVLTGFVAGGLLFSGTFLFRHRRETIRIQALTEYLEKVNTGGSGILFQTGEDDFSKLQDEIYKTVTSLHQMRDAAEQAKNSFAENLYNIAHQIKTPITSISLTVQMMQVLSDDAAAGRAAQQDLQDAVTTGQGEQDTQDFITMSQAEPVTQNAVTTRQTEQITAPEPLNQIKKQVARLSRLEEALLLLSRIDAGTLPFQRKEIDVLTLLMLSADNLQELFRQADVAIEIPETEETGIYADMDWTMEAVTNLMKNCMEHTPPGGTVRCSYAQNPLYTQISISDTGAGFDRADIPHLFERFYRGRNAKDGGIGIGLALSREIIERQNGTVTAGNLPEGGACFEIRFYCH